MYHIYIIEMKITIKPKYNFKLSLDEFSPLGLP